MNKCHRLLDEIMGRLKHWFAELTQTSFSSQSRRMFPIAVGVSCAFVANSSYALNGNIYVLSCACQTTDQFSTAAIAASNDQGWGGSYFLTSTITGSTALMQVHGKHLIDKHGNDYWLASSTIPLDDAGNSLSGQSESALEGYYQTLDLATYGVDRSNPILLANNSPGASFINSDDSDVSTLINSSFPNMSLTVGVMTVEFLDGTTAQFRQTAPKSKVWVWNGIAHNSAGQRINRDGTVISDPNTSGTGGGHADTAGFGKGAGWSFEVGGLGSCTSVTTITVNGDSTNYMYVHPC